MYKTSDAQYSCCQPMPSQLSPWCIYLLSVTPHDMEYPFGHPKGWIILAVLPASFLCPPAYLQMGWCEKPKTS